MRRVLLSPLFLFACGNAEIVAPEPLSILDTYPGNGSVVPAGEQPIVITFSQDVVSDLLEASVRLEETTPQGTPIREVAVALDRYDRETFTSVFSTEPFPPDATYALTVRSESLRATGGARLLTDLIRRFRTR